MVEQLMPGSKRFATIHTAIYIITGEYDKAIERLKELVDIPGSSIRLWDLRLDPGYDSLRNDTRFQELIAQEK